MSNRIVTAAVDRHFRPPNAARAARRQVFVVALVFVVLLAVGPQLADELTRRLNALPPSIRRVLDGTATEGTPA